MKESKEGHEARRALRWTRNLIKKKRGQKMDGWMGLKGKEEGSTRDRKEQK